MTQERRDEEPQGDPTGEALGVDIRWHTDFILTADSWAEGTSAQLLDGTSWRRFATRVAAIDDLIRDPRFPSDPVTRTDGYRFAATLLRNALDFAVDDLDPGSPRVRWYTGRYKIGWDCPDALYGSVNLEPGARYRLHGHRGSVRFLGLQTMAGVRTLRNTHADEWPIDADGHFELLLGPDVEGPGTLPLDPDADKLLVRQFFYDWVHEEPARVDIERLDDGAGTGVAEPLDPQRLARTLDAVMANVESNLRLWASINLSHREERANRFTGQEFGGSWGGQTHQVAGITYLRVEPGEALILEVPIPRAHYWEFSLCNFWAETLDYSSHQSSLNGHQARVGTDGTFRAVVSHEDPGVPNWLDPVGHSEASIIYRWNLTDARRSRPRASSGPTTSGRTSQTTPRRCHQKSELPCCGTVASA